MANEMRDRLVELVQDALFKYAHYVGKERRRALEPETEAEHSEIYESIKALHEYVADHLIENGAVVPPCKVGDTVWILFAVEKNIEGREIASIMQRNTSWTMTFTNGSCFTVWDNEDDEYFGKTVFLTKAEAEQKLKEMRGG